MLKEGNVIAIVAKILEIDSAELSPMASSETIESWDSARHFLIVLAIEEECGIEFTTKQFRQATSIVGIAQVLEQLQGQS